MPGVRFRPGAAQDAYGRPLVYADPPGQQQETWADPSVAERAGFESRIDENPLEATHHLAFADWLDERGEHDEAAFRRAIGEWTQRGTADLGEPTENLSGRSFHTSRRPPWTHSVWRGNLPSWAQSPNAPASVSDRFRSRIDSEPHLALAPNDYWLHWQSYRDMEEGLRRAFMANLARQRQQGQPPTTASRAPQDANGNPLEYDDEPPTPPAPDQNLAGDGLDPRPGSRVEPLPRPVTPPTNPAASSPGIALSPGGLSGVRRGSGAGSLPPPVDDPFERHLDAISEMGVRHGHFLSFVDEFAPFYNDMPDGEKIDLLRRFGLDPADPEAGLALVRHVWGARGDGRAPAPGGPQDEAGEYLGTPEREVLAKSPVVESKPIGGGHINPAHKLLFSDGTEGVFKPLKGEYQNGRVGIPNNTLYRREVAASVVADLLGFGDLVPPTTFREVNGEIGSVQKFVPSKAAADAPSMYRYDGDKDLARAAVLDYILGHSDRHAGNWHVAGEGSTGGDPNRAKLVLIDNGFSLPTKHANRDYWRTHHRLWNEAVERDLDVPDMSAAVPHWGDVEKALRAVGIEEEAIALARKRFQSVASGHFRKVGDLPAFFREDPARPDAPVYPLREYAKHPEGPPLPRPAPLRLPRRGVAPPPGGP